MRYSKIHLNRVVGVAMVLAIVIAGLTGIQLIAAQITPIAAQAAISNSEPLSGNFSSIQPGAAPITRMTAQATITDLGNSDPYGINDLGQVVGGINASGGNRAFLWQNGTMIDLGTLGGSGSWAWDINNLGQVVGSSNAGTGDYGHAFLWENGTMIDLGNLGVDYSSATGINNLGQVVGWSYTAGGKRAFLWQNGTMTDLGTLSGPHSEARAINDLGQIVGSSVISPMGWTHAFLWQNGTMTDLGALPGGTQSWAYDINKLGQVVGDSWTSLNTRQRAVLWQNGRMTDLGTLGGSDSAAEAINDLGQIVGYSSTGTGAWHNFLWQDGRMIDLNNLVDPSSGWTLGYARGINNVGQVVGFGYINSQTHGFLLTLPPDLSVENVVPVQVLENQDLVKYKATAVKAVIRKDGASTAESVSVKLVYGASTYERFYVADGGNLDQNHALIADNSTYPLNFATDEITKTIYFFDDGLAPLGSTFQVSATVDYLDEIAELDEDNNTTPSTVAPVYDIQWPPESAFPNLNIYYIRTDGISRPDRDALYAASNNFIKGVYPVAERRFLPGRASMTLDTSRARGSDGRLDILELEQWATGTLASLWLAYDDADRFVAAVPVGWFQATTTDTYGVTLTKLVGVAFPAMPELVIAEALTSNWPNGSNVVAHEIGHSYGLDLSCEEYDAHCDGDVDSIGNIAAPGLWVNERIPIQIPTQRDVYCFMGVIIPGLEYWVDSDDYAKLFNDHRPTTALQAGESMMAAGAILVVANFDPNGAVTLDNWYTLPEAELSELPPGPYAFEYQDANGNFLYQHSFDISYSMEGYTLPQVTLVAKIPNILNTAKIVVKHNGIPQAEKVFSANTPAVTVTSPNGGEQLMGPATIHWSGSDADGDALSYAVLISPDNGATWEPIAGNLTATSYTWDISQLSAGAHYLIKVIATDGINTGHDLSDAPFTIKAPIYLPLILRRS